ncbi:hypothetical protein R5P82_05970 [Oenococcus oeni]
MSREIDKKFLVDYFFVSDSKMEIFFLEDTPTKIDKDVSIRTGIHISNSEIADGAAVFEMTYKISSGNKKITFLSDDIAKVNHGYNPKTISEGLENIANFNIMRKDIINAVKAINWSSTISDKVLYELISLVGHLGNNIPKKVRDKMKSELNAIKTAKKTTNLLEVFNKLGQVVDEESSEIQLIMESKFAEYVDKLK